MRKVVVTAILGYMAVLCCAQTAYIAAPSGLKLRKTADAKGVVVKTITYASKVNRVKDAKPQVAHKTQEAPGFTLKGHWQKVAAGADTGYVFSAFLLPFEPITKKEWQAEMYDTTADCKPFEQTFLEKGYKKQGAMYEVEKYDAEYSFGNKNSPYCVKKYKQDYAGGNITIEYYGYNGEGGGGSTITFKKGVDFNTVYAMALSYTSMLQENLRIFYENGGVSMGPAEDDAGCGSFISMEGTIITWSFGCGC